MNSKRRKSGFTMAELLIVVAIIGVLAGVSFVAVQTHQKSMDQIELDSVAREIFVAAQNHLAMAKSEGYLGETGPQTPSGGDPDTNAGTPTASGYGTLGTADADKDADGKAIGIYYLTVEDGVIKPAEAAQMFSLMLPLYSLDATVLGGNYIIRYQPESGLVLDVFYWSPNDKFRPSSVDYDTLMKGYRDMNGSDHRGDRRSYNGGVIGWYGGTMAADLAKGEPLKPPVTEVVNSDKLLVKVTDTNKEGNNSLALIVTGKASGAQNVFILKENGANASVDGRLTQNTPNFEIVLDDITTAELQFAKLRSEVSGVTFIPGEDIAIRAVAYDNSKLSNIAYSDEKTVNSLFEKADNADGTAITVDSLAPGKLIKTIKPYVNNIRHLENLDYSISKVDYCPVRKQYAGVGGSAPTAMIVEVEQTTDISWSGDVFNASTTIGTAGATGCLLPVNVPDTYTIGSSNLQLAIAYDGKGHSISNIKVNSAAEAGLFGTLQDGSSVANLALVDFNVTSTGTGKNAGALAGTLIQSATWADANATNISNVAAYNTGNGDAATVTATGNAGGLIGEVKGKGTTACNARIAKSAASLVVTSSGGNAGGLIGTISGGTVSDCYSGGHTTNAQYSDTAFNVTAAGTGKAAGGLIGSANAGSASITIENSYSTCSATGPIAGGLAGTITGASGAGAASSSVTNCYATGLVKGTTPETAEVKDAGGTVTYTDFKKEGAFAYSVSGTVTVSGCNYFEIINPRTVSTQTGTGDAAKTGIEEIYLAPLGQNVTPPAASEGAAASIAKLDDSASTYEAFVGAPSGWGMAVPYDAALYKYYSVDQKTKFNLKTVAQMGATLKTSSDDDTVYFVANHYGDWPAPEIFVMNTAS